MVDEQGTRIQDVPHNQPGENHHRDLPDPDTEHVDQNFAHQYAQGSSQTNLNGSAQTFISGHTRPDDSGNSGQERSRVAKNMVTECVPAGGSDHHLENLAGVLDCAKPT